MSNPNKKAAAVLRRHLGSLKLGAGVAAIAVASAWVVPAFAQQTTSSMTGSITTSSGAPAVGAQVEIVHTPSGTRSVTTVNSEGRFQASGLRVGGPYTVTVSSANAQPQVVDGVFVSLGEPYALDLTLGESVGEIVATGQRSAPTTVGIGTRFSERQIENAPTINRDLKDIVRNDPKVFVDVTNSNAIQIAGSNNRFNSLTVDGVKQNDDFGLNGGGYPTQRAPLSVEAIGGLSVLTAPYDVEYSGFQGGTINIVTKSGENTPHGSFYYYYGDENLSGDRSGGRRNLISPYKERTWGGSLGGALIQDKVFFYVNYEKYRNQAPVIYGTSDSGLGNPVSGITTAQVEQIRQIAKDVYGYDTLGLADGTLPEADEKILTKLDWNINDDHRASFAYQRNEGNNIIDATSSTSATPRTLSLQSNFYNRTQIMNSYSFQLFSDWTSDFSTEVKVARKDVESLRDPLNGLGFGEFRINTTPGTSGTQAVFGPDLSSHSNYLTTTTDSAKLKGTYLLGDHKIVGGYEYDKYDYFNLFLQRSLGQWEFASIADFQARKASRFRYANAVSGNANDAAASWKYTQHSFYLQDTWDISPDFQLQGGLRYELYKSDDKPVANANFASRYGFSNTETLDGKDLWLPRLGFTYEATDSTKFRGGAGLFSGVGPAVWLSNNYSNDGVTQRSLDTNGDAVTAAIPGLLNGVTGQVPTAAVARLSALGEGFVNALDPNFEMPSSWKFSMAVDQKLDIPGLGDNWLITAEAIYTRVKDATFYKDLRLVQTGTAPDGRPIYSQKAQTTVNSAGATVARPAGSDLVLTNTDKGKGLVLSLFASNNWETDYGNIDFGVGYAYQDVDDASQGTSSVASSNYGNFVTTDPNSDLLGVSSYEQKHRFTSNATYSIEYFDGYKSSISLFGQAFSGKPYTYSFSCSSTANPFGDPACRGNTSRQALYVPTGATDPLVNWNAAGSIKPADMDAYISRNGLDKYRGGIVPRGAFESSWTYQVDAKLAQEIPSPIEGHKAEFTLDIINLTNLINKNWGRQQSVPFFQSIAGPQATIQNGQYVFTSTGRDVTEQINNRASVWKIQVGVRYQF
ncbi:MULTISPECIES: TonB-dependent receptor [unclassified Azospirillum]|uniref:TonB-dependent receptor n=1 Tax=unclassified Azospirillum TaxID=2630922 RepID=UPI000B6DD6E2|nr:MULTISPECIES: TonB-dependent receptor [unclassified Azospirillum]SNT03477.1 TonB-dependent Receptor Plug Domain [Azospirillum sp. RU38E]SNT19307.1 TonB-dependent Receptor Plug Domain [Azospirillum sp. RU37A]